MLIAAHGDAASCVEGSNLSRIVQALAARRIAAEVGVGFIAAQPSVGEAIQRFGARFVVVAPLFFSDGFMCRVRLPQLLAESRGAGRCVRLLKPVGLDPGLAAVVGRRAADAAGAYAVDPRQATLILLAHGSCKDSASRLAAQQLAGRIASQARFAGVRCAFLEESPCLNEAAAGLAGPLIVAGLFAGEGRHGSEDVRRLLAELGRTDVVFAGNVGAYPEIADLIAAAVATVS